MHFWYWNGVVSPHHTEVEWWRLLWSKPLITVHYYYVHKCSVSQVLAYLYYSRASTTSCWLMVTHVHQWLTCTLKHTSISHFRPIFRAKWVKTQFRIDLTQSLQERSHTPNQFLFACIEPVMELIAVPSLKTILHAFTQCQFLSIYTVWWPRVLWVGFYAYVHT